MRLSQAEFNVIAITIMHSSVSSCRLPTQEGTAKLSPTIHLHKTKLFIDQQFHYILLNTDTLLNQNIQYI